MNTESSSADPAPRTPGTARLGRRLGVSLFWLVCIYLIGMSVRSIVPALYFPSIAPHPKQTTVERCAAELDDLQRELGQAAARSFARGRVDAWNKRLKAWDARISLLATGCGPFEPVRTDLLALRGQLDAIVREYGASALETQRRVRKALSARAGADPS